MSTLAADDPRVSGGVYLSGYWQARYMVLAMWTPADADVLWFRVRWLDTQLASDRPGGVSVHCTAWDRTRDKVLSVPD